MAWDNSGAGFTWQGGTFGTRWSEAPAPFYPAPAATPPPVVPAATPPVPAAVAPLDPQQLAAVLYDKAIPLGFSTRAQWGGRIIEGPVFSTIGGERVVSFIAGYYIPVNFLDDTRTISSLSFRGQLAWTLTDGAYLSGLNVGVATVGGAQTVRFATGTLAQTPDAWSVARYGAQAVAYVPMVTATFENIRIAQFGNAVPFTSVMVDDTAYGTPGDLVAWADAIEALARYDGRGPDEFATVDVMGGIGALILGSKINFIEFLSGMRKHKPQWNVRTADKLYLVEKGFALDLTLDRAKLLSHGAQPITVHNTDAFDKPRERICHYLDVTRDYEPSNVRVAEDIDPVISSDSFETDNYDIPVASSADIVMNETSFAYYTNEVARQQSEFSGMAYYLGLEPGDLYKWTTAGGRKLYHRVNEIVRGADFTVDVKGEAFLNCAIEALPATAVWTDITTRTSDGIGGKSLAFSGDGLTIVRSAPYSVNVSHDGGAIFTNAFTTEECWVAASTNGSVVALGITSTVAIPANAVQISTNGGTTWTAHAIPGINYARSVSVSGDGSKIIVGGIYTPMGDGKVYISADGGTTWTGRVPYAYLAGADWIDGVKISRDGSTIYANASGGNVLAKSIDGGATWINVAPIYQTDLTVNAPDPGSSYNVMGFTCSANGQILMAYEDYEVKIWVSTNAGASWADRTPPDVDWGLSGGGLCMSDDGMILYTISNDYIYRSTDRGASWVKQDQPNLPGSISLRSVACSADGKHVVASDYDTLWVGDFT